MTYDINSNILTKTGVTSTQLDAALKSVAPNNEFSSASMFTDAEAKYSLNALFIAAHAAIESAWGSSFYAQTRNNLFGFNAVDSNPDSASYYPSQAAAVDYYASFLLENYLTAGGEYYNGPTPHGVFIKYSSSHDTEARSIVDIMNSLEQVLPNVTGENEMIETDDQAIDLFVALFHEVPQNITQEAINSVKGQPYATVVPALIKYDKWRNQNDQLVQYPKLLDAVQNANGTATAQIAAIKKILGQ